MSSTSMTTTPDGGLVISSTEAISNFLSSASTNPKASPQLRDLASSLSDKSSVPYKPLKSIWLASDPETRPNLLHLLSGSGFILTSPEPRQKSAELQERLRKLEEAAERKAYDELVKDVAPKRTVEEPFSAYKDQIGFGMHVVLIMFTGYLVGFYAFRALFSQNVAMVTNFILVLIILITGYLVGFYAFRASFSQNVAMSAAGGILGLVIGMLVETLLFIIRTSSQNAPSVISTSRMKKTQ